MVLAISITDTHVLALVCAQHTQIHSCAKDIKETLNSKETIQSLPPVFKTFWFSFYFSIKNRLFSVPEILKELISKKKKKRTDFKLSCQIIDLVNFLNKERNIRV